MRDTPQVLMVDDNPADVTLAMEAWAPNAQRIQVKFAGDGDQAMAYLDGMEREDNAPPDLIILDLNLPRKNGRSVLADLKADPKRRAIPVVIFSTCHRGEFIRTSGAENSHESRGSAGEAGQTGKVYPPTGRLELWM